MKLPANDRKTRRRYEPSHTLDACRKEHGCVAGVAAVCRGGNRQNPQERNTGKNQWLVELTGLEPVTSCMPCKRSSKLSYSPWLPRL